MTHATSILFSHQIEAPYPGLRPFQPHESAVFFGRDEHVADMLTVLENHRFLAVVGPSGGGKSSLVLAGLIPALERGELLTAQSDDWRFVILRPGDAPYRNLADAAQRHLWPNDNMHHFHDGDAGLTELVLRGSPFGFVEALRDAAIPADANVLLVVDQFEELFRFRAQDSAVGEAAAKRRDDAATLVQLLLETAKQTRRPVYVMLTMRSDFLGDCDVFDGLPQAINQSQYLTPRLNLPQLSQAIVRPLQQPQFQGSVAPELVQRNLNDIGTARDELPIVQHALFRTWQKAKEVRPGDTLDLTLPDYDAVGGLKSALSLHADEALNECQQRGQEWVVEKVFRGLCTRGTDGQQVRRPATIQQLADESGESPDDVKSVVETFRRNDRCFLMPPVPRELTATTKIDISHESLLRLWDRMGEWVRGEAGSAERFQDLCHRVEARHGGGDLLGRLDLRRFQSWFDHERPTSAWAARYGGRLEPSVAFLKESTDAILQEDERKRHAETRKRRGVIAALCVLSLFAAVLWVFWRIADLARDEFKEKDWDGRLLYANSESERARYARSASLHVWLHDRLAPDDARRDALRKFVSSECSRLGMCLVHDGSVERVLFSTDGSLILTVDAPLGTARTWHAETGTPASLLVQHVGRIMDAAFSPNGQLVATAGVDDTVRIWDSTTAKDVVQPLKHENDIIAVAFSADGSVLATACLDNMLRFWNPLSGQLIGEPIRHGGTVGKIVAFADGRRFATCCADGEVRLIDVRTPERPPISLPHDSSVTDVALSPDCSLLVAACMDGNVFMWDVETGKKLWDQPVQHDSIPTALGFSSNGEMIATGSNDTTACVWEVKTGRQIGKSMKHAGGVRGILFLDEDRKLVTGSLDGAIRLWDYRTGRQIATPLRHQAAVWDLRLSTNHETLLSASSDGTARVWQLKGQVQDYVTLPIQDVARHAVIDPSGNHLLTSHNNKKAIVWNTENWQQLKELPHESFVSCGEFDATGSTVVTAGGDLRVRLWNAQTGSEVGTVPSLLPSVPNSIARSASQSKVVIATLDGDLFSLDLQSHELHKLTKRHTGGIYGMALSPKGDLLATAGMDKLLCFWDGHTLEPVGEPLNLNVILWSVAFSLNGSHLAIGDSDGTIWIWDALSRKKVGQIPAAHEGYVGRCSFNLRGDTVVTGGMDRSVRFWDVESRLVCGVPLRHEGELSVVSWTPDGRKLLTAAFDKTMRLWNLVPPAIDDPRHPERLRLSVEVRTGCRVDEDGNVVRLNQAEWLERQEKLFAMGGPCDVPTWEEYEATQSILAK